MKKHKKKKTKKLCADSDVVRGTVENALKLIEEKSLKVEGVWRVSGSHPEIDSLWAKCRQIYASPQSYALSGAPKTGFSRSGSGTLSSSSSLPSSSSSSPSSSLSDSNVADVTLVGNVHPIYRLLADEYADKGNVHNLTGLVVAVLTQLSEPLIPFDLYDLFVQAAREPSVRRSGKQHVDVDNENASESDDVMIEKNGKAIGKEQLVRASSDPNMSSETHTLTSSSSAGDGLDEHMAAAGEAAAAAKDGGEQEQEVDDDDDESEEKPKPRRRRRRSRYNDASLKRRSTKRSSKRRSSGSAAAVASMAAAAAAVPDDIVAASASGASPRMFASSRLTPSTPASAGIVVGKMPLSAEDAECRTKCLRCALALMPRANLALVQRLVGVLRRVVEERERNKMSTVNVAIVFAPVLLRPENETLELMMRDADDAVTAVASMVDFMSDVFRHPIEVAPSHGPSVGARFKLLLAAARQAAAAANADGDDSLVSSLSSSDLSARGGGVHRSRVLTMEDHLAAKIQALYRGWAMRSRYAAIGDKEVQRAYNAALRELVERQRGAARRCDELLAHYLPGLRKVLAEEEARQLLALAEPMVLAQHQFLEALESLWRRWPFVASVGRALTDDPPLFGACPEYLNRASAARRQLLAMADGNVALRHFLQRSLPASGTRLDQLLVLPLEHLRNQRTGIELPLIKLIRAAAARRRMSPAAADDLRLLLLSRALLRRIVATYDHLDRLHEIGQVQRVSNALVHTGAERHFLVEPGRRLIREGPMSVASERRYVFLFNDTLLVAKASGKVPHHHSAGDAPISFAFKYMLPLRSASLFDIGDAGAKHFVVDTPERRYNFTFKTAAARLPWLQAVQGVLGALQPVGGAASSSAIAAAADAAADRHSALGHFGVPLADQTRGVAGGVDALPPALTTLVELVVMHGDESSFLMPADSYQLSIWQAALDAAPIDTRANKLVIRDTTVSGVTLESKLTADLLLLWLEMLPEPLVPLSCLLRDDLLGVDDGAPSVRAFHSMLQQLPVANVVALRHLFRLFAEQLHVPAETLASVVAPHIIWLPDYSTCVATLLHSKRLRISVSIVTVMIRNFADIFDSLKIGGAPPPPPKSTSTPAVVDASSKAASPASLARRSKQTQRCASTSRLASSSLRARARIKPLPPAPSRARGNKKPSTPRASLPTPPSPSSTTTSSQRTIVRGRPPRGRKKKN
jgi:RhoGAP domain